MAAVGDNFFGPENNNIRPRESRNRYTRSSTFNFSRKSFIIKGFIIKLIDHLFLGLCFLSNLYDFPSRVRKVPL